MRSVRIAVRAAVGAATAIALLSGAGAAQAATKTTGKTGTQSLAQVLARDTSGFDRNSHDFDVLSAAVNAVLKAKPGSAVKVLADGKTPVTAFLPNDAAFRRLVADITGKKKWPSEKQAFTAVAGLGIDTVEKVLLYHVVPGATIDRRAALKSDGAKLATAAGASVKIDVYGHWWKRVRLIDADRSDRDPRVIKFDVNRGNKQIAHVIDRVLRPTDLP